MAEYIKRIDALKICRVYSEHCFDTNDSRGQDIADRIEDDIAALPTADVAKVKRGEWVKPECEPLYRLYSDNKCSECGFVYCGDKTPYCPSCSAKMDGGKGE